MLHITNGDSAAAGIRKIGVPGQVLSWIDVLHEGPVPDLGLEQLRTVRAQFVASCGWTSFEDAIARPGARRLTRPGRGHSLVRA